MELTITLGGRGGKSHLNNLMIKIEQLVTDRKQREMLADFISLKYSTTELQFEPLLHSIKNQLICGVSVENIVGAGTVVVEQ